MSQPLTKISSLFSELFVFVSFVTFWCDTVQCLSWMSSEGDGPFLWRGLCQKDERVTSDKWPWEPIIWFSSAFTCHIMIFPVHMTPFITNFSHEQCPRGGNYTWVKRHKIYRPRVTIRYMTRKRSCVCLCVCVCVCVCVCLCVCVCVCVHVPVCECVWFLSEDHYNHRSEIVYLHD